MNEDKLQYGIEENLPIPKKNELWEAIKKGNLTNYTPTQIEQGMLQEDKNGKTLYHDAAREGHLDKIPKETLTEENLLQPDWEGKTCLHYAAAYNHLDQIPPELLTKKNLLQTDPQGFTCLHWAAYEGRLDHIPPDLLTAKNLLQTDYEGETCLDKAAFRGHLEKHPLPYQTLLDLKTHYQKDSSTYQKEILTFIQNQIQKKINLDKIKRSLTQNHKALF